MTAGPIRGFGWEEAMHPQREDLIRTILVGVDGSEESQGAVLVAAGLARVTKSRLDIACAVPAIEIDSVEPTVLPRSMRTRRTEQAFQMLSTFAEKCGTEAVTSLLEGGAADCLAREAEREDVWLVVVGHRGRGAVQRTLLGSVADRLVQTCPKPVLVTR